MNMQSSGQRDALRHLKADRNAERALLSTKPWWRSPWRVAALVAGVLLLIVIGAGPDAAWLS